MIASLTRLLVVAFVNQPVQTATAIEVQVSTAADSPAAPVAPDVPELPDVTTLPDVPELPETTDWIRVEVQPARIMLPNRQVFTLRALVDSLASRVEPVGMTVVPVDATEIPPGAPWQLLVTAQRGAIRVQLKNPKGQEVLSQRIKLGRRSAHDLSETATLAALEGMAELLEELIAMLPDEEVMRSTEPEAEAKPTVAEVMMPAPEPSSIHRWRLGAHGHSVATLPGAHSSWGGGLSAGYGHGLLTVSANITAWAPLRATHDTYSLRVQYGTAHLAAGLHHTLGPLDFSIEMGPAIRVLHEDRDGMRTDHVAHWYVNSGGVLKVAVALELEGGWVIELAPTGSRFWPYQQFTADGELILDVGSTMLGATLGAFYRF